MAVRVTVSKQPPIAVPSAVRKQLGIHSGDELLVELRGGNAVLLPAPRVSSQRLRGLHCSGRRASHRRPSWSERFRSIASRVCLLGYPLSGIAPS